MTYRPHPTLAEQRADVVPAHVLAAFEQHTAERQAHADAVGTALDELAADPEHPADEEQPRPHPRVLSDDEYSTACGAAISALGARSHNPGMAAVYAALDAALFTLGILPPPPEPEPGTCPALFADPDGAWRQCAEDRSHNPAAGHNDGEWAWADGQTFAEPEDGE